MASEHAPNSDVVEWDLPSLADTDRLGLLIAEAVEAVSAADDSSGLVIALRGPLGAGKTALVKAVCRGLGVEEVVTSPTFTTLNEYHSGLLPVYHFDFYRVGESIERARDGKKVAGSSPTLDLMAMEFDEVMSGRALALIEWPELFLVGGSSYLNRLDHLSVELSCPSQATPGEKEEPAGSGRRLARIASSGRVAGVLLGKLIERARRAGRRL